MAAAPGDPSVVAVIDDDPAQAGVIEELVIDAGLRPHLVEPAFGKSVGALVGAVRAAAGSAICDHRLSPRGYAKFPGAEAVASLYAARVPALLVTQFEVDSDMDVRLWRTSIPVLLSRESVSAQSIAAALEYVRRELSGTFTTERTAQECIVRVVDVNPADRTLDVIVGAWNPHHAVQLPMSLLPTTLRRHAKIDSCFVASVNVDAERPADLYFKDFRLAPKPFELPPATTDASLEKGRVRRWLHHK
jgi:hypothetical protein